MTDSSQRDNSIHDAIDALFDQELNDVEARDLLRKADPNACEDIAKTQRVVSMLKAPVDAPDLTDAILAQVADEREFVGSRWRTIVRVGRVAVAACLLLSLMSVAVAQRLWPEATTLSVEPRPMSALLHTTEREAVDSVRALNNSLDSVHERAGVVRELVAQSRRAPEKIGSPERHVYVTARPDAAIFFTTNVDTVAGASAPCFEAEANAWHASDPHASGSHEFAKIATFRTGWTIDIESMVQFQVLQRQAQPTSVTFRKLP